MKKKKLPPSPVTFSPNEKTKVKINMTEFARKLIKNEPLSSDEIVVHCILRGINNIKKRIQDRSLSPFKDLLASVSGKKSGMEAISAFCA